MRHSVIITVLLSALACLCGCTVGTPEIRHINIASHPFEWADTAEVIIGNPLQMLRTKSALIIKDLMCDSVFHIVDLPNNRYVGAFGSIGQGPRDFSDQSVINTSDSRHDIFGIYDRRKHKYYDATIGRNESGMLSVGYNEKFNIDETGLGFISPLSNGRYVSTSSYCKWYELFDLIDNAGNMLGHYGDRQILPDELRRPASDVTAAYSANIMVSPDRSKVAAYIYFSEMAGFYRVDGDTLTLVTQFCHSRPEALYGERFKGLSDRLPDRFVNGDCDNRYVYILYSDLCFAEAPFSSATGNRILVYTWSGEQVAELHTDVRVRHFTAPDSTGRMYALTQDGCDPTLIYFDIPAI